VGAAECLILLNCLQRTYPAITKPNLSVRPMSSPDNIIRESIPVLPFNQLNGNDSIFEGKSDIEIWREFKLGSEIAFVYIYKKYFTILYRYGSQFTKDRFLLKDTIQDLFMELVKRREKLSDTTSIKYYLLKSIKTNLISKIKTLRRIDYKENLLEGFDFDISLSHEQTLINKQITEEQWLRINATIKKLKRKQREVIYYYYFQNLSLAEISSLMNFSNVKSIQNLLYRSLSAMKGHLGPLAIASLLFLLLK
jgi:RNA polymerase sigma factor (sigma-70 family)